MIKMLPTLPNHSRFPTPQLLCSRRRYFTMLLGACTVTGSTLGCDFGVCNPIGEMGFTDGAGPNGSGWSNVWHLWGLLDEIYSWADKAACAYYARVCGQTFTANAASANANRDPNKLLYDAEQCQKQGYTNCSDPEANNIANSGLFTTLACRKAAECVVGLTAPQ
jgi:hypothetical protein